MQIIVISRRSANERRNTIRTQLEQAGIEFEFFDAVTDRDVTCNFHHYDDAEYRLNNGRAAVAGELGCFASHRALWQRCVDTGEALLILEDDARILEPFARCIPALATIIDACGFIRIEALRHRRIWSEQEVDGFALGYCARVPLCTTGYTVSPRAARRLLDASEIIDEPVDKFIQRFWRHEQPVYAVTPALVDVHEVAEDSTIGARASCHPTLGLRVRRALRKSDNSVRRELYNLRYFFRAALQDNRLPRVKASGTYPASISPGSDGRAKMS